MILDMLIMQPIDLCNLNCSYCYLPGRKDPKLMSDEIIEASFRVVLNSSIPNFENRIDKLRVVWHSGEPLLAGMEFYKNVFNHLTKYNVLNQHLIHEVQSNATRINQAWCDFFKDNNINVAVSIDGPEFIHNKVRVNWAGKGTHAAVMRGIEHLRKNSIPLRAICVLTKESLNYPKEIYTFFKSNGFESLGLNVEEQEGFNNASSLNINPQNNIVNKYKSFMSEIYDLWSADDKRLNIREFSRIISLLASLKSIGFTSSVLSQEATPFAIVSITKDGYISTFSPELSGGTFKDPKKFIIGHVLEINSLDDLSLSKNFNTHYKDIKKGVQKCANECEYFAICGGGSPSNKYYENGTFNSSETSTCILSQKVLYEIVLSKLSKTNTQQDISRTDRANFNNHFAYKSDLIIE